MGSDSTSFAHFSCVPKSLRQLKRPLSFSPLSPISQIQVLKGVFFKLRYARTMLKLFKKKTGLSLEFIGFLQAFGLTVYCSLISLLMFRGNDLFGTVPNFAGPLLFLLLFSTSVLICGLVTLGYPFLLFWKEKKVVEAFKLVGYTTVWSVGFVCMVLLTVVLRRFVF